MTYSCRETPVGEAVSGKEIAETGTSSGEDVQEASSYSAEEPRTSEQETETETGAEASAESTEESSGMEMETAKRYGITEENYPVLDGSTSTFSIVLGLYSTFFDYLSPEPAEGS